MSTKNEKQTIVISATSSIGRALFKKYAAISNHISIVGRRTHLLDELRKEHPDTTVTAMADITKQNETGRAIYATTARCNPSLHLLSTDIQASSLILQQLNRLTKS